MNREDIIRMAREAGFIINDENPMTHSLERFAALVAAAERNKLAAWMIQHGYATGHGDTTEALLQELDWQIAERIAAEREACAKVCEELLMWNEDDPGSSAAKAIRARGETK